MVRDELAVVVGFADNLEERAAAEPLYKDMVNYRSVLFVAPGVVSNAIVCLESPVAGALHLA